MLPEHQLRRAPVHAPDPTRQAAVEAIFDKYDCKSSNGDKINAEVSELFRRYVSDEVLAPLGVVGTFKPVTEFAIRYDFSKPAEQGMRPDYDAYPQGRDPAA